MKFRLTVFDTVRVNCFHFSKYQFSNLFLSPFTFLQPLRQSDLYEIYWVLETFIFLALCSFNFFQLKVYSSIHFRTLSGMFQNFWGNIVNDVILHCEFCYCLGTITWKFQCNAPNVSWNIEFFFSALPTKNESKTKTLHFRLQIELTLTLSLA